MIDTKKELFKWGPIDGMPIYIDPFAKSFAPFFAYSGIAWPELAGCLLSGKITFVADYASLREKGKELLEKYRKTSGKEHGKWLNAAKNLTPFIKKFGNKLDKTELVKAAYSWDLAYTDFWIKGFLPELASWGAENILTELLKGNENFAEIFESIAAPEKLSFFQAEELELMKIAMMKDKAEAVKEHQRKYFWMENSYGSTKVVKISNFLRRIGEINVSDAKIRAREISLYSGKMRARSKSCIEKYCLNEEIVSISGILREFVSWQDERKKFIFMSNHAITRILENASLCTSVPFDELLFYTMPEVIELLKAGKRINLHNRKEAFCMYYHGHGRLEYISGKKAFSVIAPLISSRIDKSELRGMVVSRPDAGIVSGKARILSSPNEIARMKEGEILVTAMTSPDFINAMRKAKAIVTDEGGMTSHAAIISRELGIPCIVGTKHATKSLKDGQSITLDTKKGTVK